MANLYMMNLLFTLFDLGTLCFGNEHLTQKSDLMRYVCLRLHLSRLIANCSPSLT